MSYQRRGIDALIRAGGGDASGDYASGFEASSIFKTEADVDDLIKVNDFKIAQTDKVHRDYGAAWQAKDPAAYSVWLSYWVGLKARFANAKARTTFKTMKSFGKDRTWTPAPLLYKQVEDAVADSSGLKGIDALTRELTRATGHDIDASAEPPPIWSPFARPSLDAWWEEHTGTSSTRVWPWLIGLGIFAVILGAGALLAPAVPSFLAYKARAGVVKRLSRPLAPTTGTE